MAAVTLRNLETGVEHEEAALGHGPIEALFRAIERIVALPIHLTSYRLKSVTGGEDAMGDVRVEVELEGKPVTGRAVNNNIIEGSAQALINVVSESLS
jgi:2-isopropylmalate synthase